MQILASRNLAFLSPALLAVPLILGARPALLGEDGGHTGTDHEALGHVALIHTLTLPGAHAVLDSAMAEARRLGVGGGFAVVDAAGELLAFARLDGTFGAASNVAVAKARTAVRFAKPTSVFEEIINGGRTAMAGMPDFMPLQGGVPIVIQGHVVGAIGVSGASSAKQDEELARAGLGGLDRTE